MSCIDTTTWKHCGVTGQGTSLLAASTRLTPICTQQESGRGRGRASICGASLEFVQDHGYPKLTNRSPVEGIAFPSPSPLTRVECHLPTAAPTTTTASLRSVYLLSSFHYLDGDSNPSPFLRPARNPFSSPSLATSTENIYPAISDNCHEVTTRIRPCSSGFSFGKGD
ncbi:hypothetical protein B0H12DRAFT_345053 [Mycena haematopus]|nr:hypothetical protein B0H12DRAFT_345053 [Mycena haematopus]